MIGCQWDGAVEMGNRYPDPFADNLRIRDCWPQIVKITVSGEARPMIARVTDLCHSRVVSPSGIRLVNQRGWSLKRV